MKTPDPQSLRTQKRHNRGWTSLQMSSRKHIRAERRLASAQTIGGTRYPAGTKVDPPATGKTQTYLQTAGGSVNYW